MNSDDVPKMRQFGVAIVWNVCYNQDTLEGGGKMRGVIYARYSSDNQREESIEGQIRENTAYAERNGITIVGHYIDRAYSAKTDNRPEFQRMIKDSARHGFDVIIVWKLDRFARNRYDSARYKMLESNTSLNLLANLNWVRIFSQSRRELAHKRLDKNSSRGEPSRLLLPCKSNGYSNLFGVLSTIFKYFFKLKNRRLF